MTELWWREVNFNDTAGSYSCGRNVKVTFANNEWWRSNRWNSTSGRVRNPDIGGYMNDKVTSMWMEPYDHRNLGAVNVFSGANCAGYAASFRFEGGNEGTGYTETDMMREGIPRNSASSVMVPLGYYVDIWSDDGLRGSKKTIVGYTDPQGRMPCIDLGWMNN